MKESEAKERLCPFFGPAVIIAAAAHRSNENPDVLVPTLTNSLYCVGSDCMAWRWTGGISVNEVAGATSLLDIDEGLASGYCGLAGIPK